MKMMIFGGLFLCRPEGSERMPIRFWLVILVIVVGIAWAMTNMMH